MKACSIIQFQDWAFLSGPEVVKDHVLGENDIMFDGMDGYIVDAHVEVGLFHAVPVFFHQAEGSFDPSAKRFEFLIDGIVR